MTRTNAPCEPLSVADTPEARLRIARRNVDMKMGFYVHAAVYVLVNAFLAIVDITRGGGAWFQWPLLGWGLGLAIHGAVVWLGTGGGGVRERMLKDELARLE
jgi:hypothetical protein